MANYTTSSGFPDLVGSMDASNDNVNSYFSNTLGAATVRNLGGAGLHFSVNFPGPGRNYTINANLNGNGNGFSGNANNNSPIAAEETWTATATTGDTVDASAAEDATCGTDEETAAKTAAS